MGVLGEEVIVSVVLGFDVIVTASPPSPTITDSAVEVVTAVTE